jgi:hypothetical protein
MKKLSTTLLISTLLIPAALSTQTAMAAEVLIIDAKSQPESLSAAPDGTLYVGSASTPFVYRVKSGSTTPEKFVDASGEGPGTFFFGMLVDPATNTLWTCQLTPVPNVTPVKRHTALRGFDLASGAQKLRWNLPGDNSTCTISPSAQTKPSTLATPPIAKSTSSPPVLLMRTCSLKIERSMASTGSRF